MNFVIKNQQKKKRIKFFFWYIKLFGITEQNWGIFYFIKWTSRKINKFAHTQHRRLVRNEAFAMRLHVGVHAKTTAPTNAQSSLYGLTNAIYFFGSKCFFDAITEWNSWWCFECFFLSYNWSAASTYIWLVDEKKMECHLFFGKWIVYVAVYNTYALAPLFRYQSIWKAIVAMGPLFLFTWI